MLHNLDSCGWGLVLHLGFWFLVLGFWDLWFGFYAGTYCCLFGLADVLVGFVCCARVCVVILGFMLVFGVGVLLLWVFGLDRFCVSVCKFIV